VEILDIERMAESAISSGQGVCTPTFKQEG